MTLAPIPVPPPPPISTDMEAILLSNEALAVANVPPLPIQVTILAVNPRNALSWVCNDNIEADTTDAVAKVALAEAFKAFNWITVLPVVLIKLATVEPIPVIAPAWALFVIADNDALVSNAVILVPVAPPPNEDDKLNILLSTDVLNGK